MAKKPGSKKEIVDDSLGQAAGADGNVDQIREILFGGQMRDYDARFDAIEKRLAKNIERASQAMEKKLDQLTATTQAEVNKLHKQLADDAKQRESEGQEAKNEAQAMRDQLESGFAEVEMHLAKEVKELRNALLDQNDELATQLEATRSSLTESLKSETDNLSDTKLNRRDMAMLLTDIASRIDSESS